MISSLYHFLKHQFFAVCHTMGATGRKYREVPRPGGGGGREAARGGGRRAARKAAGSSADAGGFMGEKYGVNDGYTHDGSMYVCYFCGNIYHQYTPVLLAYIIIYTIHGFYGIVVIQWI